MKKTPFAVIAILATSIVGTTWEAFAATQTLDGVVSDSMCITKHMMPGKTEADCVKECVKAGSKYVLVVGDKSYTLNAKPGIIAPFAGKHVQVQGDVKQKSIDLTAIR